MQAKASRSLPSLCLAIPALLLVPAFLGAVRPPERQAFPDLDLHLLARPAPAAAAVDTGALRARLGDGLRYRIDPLTGLPAVMVRPGVGRMGPARPGMKPEEAARAFLSGNADLFPFSPGEMAEMEVRRLSPDAATGMTFLTFAQKPGGIRIFGGEVRVAVGPEGGVWAASASRLRPGARPARTHAGSPGDALRDMADAVHVTAPWSPVPSAGSAGEGVWTFERGPFRDTIRVEQVWFLEGSRLLPAWKGVLHMPDGRAVYQVVVEDGTGRLLHRRNIVLYADTRGNVFPEHPGAGPRQVLPFPDNFGYVVLESPEGWAFADETIGWNTDTKDDRAGDNEATDGTRGQAAGSGTAGDPYLFDPPFSDDAMRDLEMGVVGLFYLTNFAHDYYYALGFDEAAGNFQVDNFGRGGLENDPVYADAQDSWSNCNARFIPSPDGVPGRMEMCIWYGTADCSASGTTRDGSLDGDIVIHEYGHGVTTRIVGGRDDFSCLAGIQSGAMGEGWSDYFPGSVFDDPLLAEYGTFDGLVSGGLRTQPMDAPVQRYTYADLCTLTGNPTFPCEVHTDGEIWAQTLWDLRTVLVNRFGPEAGADLADRLVLNGLKFTPCNPTFLDARDGILAADRAMYGGVHQCTIWQAFARGGMGAGASSAGDNDQAPAEAFDMPAECVNTSVARLDRDSYMCEDSVTLTVTDPIAIPPVSVTFTTSSGDSLTVDATGVPPHLTAQVPFVVGPVDPGDAVLQASNEGDTITATFLDANTGNPREDTAVVDCTAEVSILRTEIVSESCDDDTVPGYPYLPRFLDADESVLLNLHLASATPGRDLTGTTVQLTTTHGAVTIEPSGPISLGTLSPPVGSAPAGEVVLEFALTAGSLVGQDSADFTLNLTADGATRASGDTFTLDLNRDYEVLPGSMFEDFESGGPGWFHMPGAPPQDEWHLQNCNAYGGSTSAFHNGGTGCTDYSDDQTDPYVASAPLPLPPEARAVRLIRLEFFHNVDLGANRLFGFPIDAEVVMLGVQNDPILVDRNDPLGLFESSIAIFGDLPELEDYIGFPIDSNTNGQWVMQEFFPAPELTAGLDAQAPVHVFWSFLPDVTDFFFPCPNQFCQAQGGGYYLDDVTIEYEYVRTVDQAASCAAGNCALALNVNARFLGPSCPGDLVTLDASATGAVHCPSGVEYVWRDDQGAELHRGSTYDFSPTGTTEVTVEATCLDDIDCTDTKPVKALVPCDIRASAAATVLPPVICPGDPFDLDGSDSFFEQCPGAGMEYRWRDPSGPLGDFSANPVFQATAGAVGEVPYTLEVRRTGDASCFDSDPVLVTVSDGMPSGSIADALAVTAGRATGEVHLDWSAGPLAPDSYSVHRSPEAGLLDVETATRDTEIAPLSGAGETYTDSPPPGTALYFYRIFGINTCDGSFVSP